MSQIQTIQDQIKQLQDQLAAAQAEVSNRRSLIAQQLTEAFSASIAALTAAEITEFSVKIVDGIPKVSFPDDRPARTRTAPGAITIPATGITRTYKNIAYRLAPREGGGYEFSGGAFHRIFANSPTAAAQKIEGPKADGTPRSINGRAWWGINA